MASSITASSHKGRWAPGPNAHWKFIGGDEPIETRQGMGVTLPSQRDKIAEVLKANGVSRESMEKRLIDAIELSKTTIDPKTGKSIYDQEKGWYLGAHDQIEVIAKDLGLDPDVVAGAVAALSPQMKWQNKLKQNYPNLENALGICEIANSDEVFTLTEEMVKGTGFPAGDFACKNIPAGILAKWHPGAAGQSFVSSRIKAIEIVRGGSLDTFLEGNKVRSFYMNLTHPTTNTGAFTVDGWQYTAMVDSKPKKDLLTGPVFTTKGASKKLGRKAEIDKVTCYPVFVDAGMAVAKKYGLLPQELQAITWSMYQGGYIK